MQIKSTSFLKPILLFILVFAFLHESRILFFSKQDKEWQDKEVEVQKDKQLTESIASDSLSLVCQVKSLQKEVSRANHYKDSLYFIFSLIVCASLPIAGLTGYVLYRRRKRKLQLEQLSRLHHLQKLKYRKSQEQLEQNKQIIASLEEKLHKIAQQADTEKSEKEALAEEILRLRNRNKQMEFQRINKQISLELLQQSEVYQFIFRNIGNANACLSTKQWEQLGEELDLTYEQFSSRLYTICPKLNETELHVCCLLKLSVPLIDIAHFTAHQKSSISTLRERLYKKIHGTQGSGKALDQFIAEF